MANSGHAPFVRPLTGLANRRNRLAGGRLWLKIIIGMLLGPGAVILERFAGTQETPAAAVNA